MNWIKHLNKLVENVVSKRTWVFAIATIALFDGYIMAMHWLTIALIYLGDKVAGHLIAQKVINKVTAETTED